MYLVMGFSLRFLLFFYEVFSILVNSLTVVGIFSFIGAVVINFYGTGIITFCFFHRDRYKIILNGIQIGFVFLPDYTWSLHPSDYTELFERMKTVKNLLFLDAFYMDRQTEKFGTYLISLQHPDVPVPNLIFNLKYVKAHAYTAPNEDNLSILERVGSNLFFSQAPVLPVEYNYLVTEVGIHTPEFMVGYMSFLSDHEGLFKSYGLSPYLDSPLSDPIRDRARISNIVLGVTVNNFSNLQDY